MSVRPQFVSPVVDHLRRKAKRIKSARRISHHESLELVAADAGYTSWHHFITEQKRTGSLVRRSRAEFLLAVRAEQLLGIVERPGGWLHDPQTGMVVHKSIPDDLLMAREYRVLQRFFLEKSPSVPLMTMEYREPEKKEGRRLYLDRSLDLADRLRGAEMEFKAWYVRSVESWLNLGFEHLYGHPGYDEYARHLWQSNLDDPNFSSNYGLQYGVELVAAITSKFPPLRGVARRIKLGETYWLREDELGNPARSIN
jgi:hypothetical protein